MELDHAVIHVPLALKQHGYPPLKGGAQDFYGNGDNNHHLKKNVYAIDFN